MKIFAEKQPNYRWTHCHCYHTLVYNSVVIDSVAIFNKELALSSLNIVKTTAKFRWLTYLQASPQTWTQL